MDYELPVILPLTTERESSVAAGGTMKEENDFEEEKEEGILDWTEKCWADVKGVIRTAVDN